MKNDERIENIETINDIENTAQNAETAVESTENDTSTSLFDENRVEEPIIEIRHLGKNFGDHEVLKDIDFDVYKGDVTCIIGSSGSGKSTLLRCINLFETPTAGEIYYHGEDITKTKSAPKYREKVTMVFQSFNLFNNMSVLSNCTIGPR